MTAPPSRVGNSPSEGRYGAFRPFGAEKDQISTTLNIFMNVAIGAAGEILILPPLSKPGDLIELRSEMDLIVSLTACSAEQTNNGRFTPIEYERI